jgi:hypothetical protein
MTADSSCNLACGLDLAHEPPRPRASGARADVFASWLRGVFRLRLRFNLSPHRQVYTVVVPAVAYASRFFVALRQESQDGRQTSNARRARQRKDGLRGRMRARLAGLRSTIRRLFLRFSLRHFNSRGDNAATALLFNLVSV